MRNQNVNHIKPTKRKRGYNYIFLLFYRVWRGIHTQWLFKINLYSYFEGKGMLYITGVSKCQKCHFLKVLFLSWINKQSYAETTRHKINK